MGLLCRLFGHKWKSCMCSRCGAKRNAEHRYELLAGRCIERCKACGKEQTASHTWDGCKCGHCGQTRDTEHIFVWNKERCVQICTVCNMAFPLHSFEHMKHKCAEACVVCGYESPVVKHDYLQIEGQCLKECSICGKEQNIDHQYANGKCTVCGEVGCHKHSYKWLSNTEIQCTVCGITQVGEPRNAHLVVRVQYDDPYSYAYRCLICGFTEQHIDGDHVGGPSEWLHKKSCIRIE